ncbi:MAG: S8 family peptidase [Firmicutes bacterium]|nr:S8 family peptidase [Bacillota bacterium]
MFFQTNWTDKLCPYLRKSGLVRQSSNVQRFIIELSRRRKDKIASLVGRNHGNVRGELDLIPSLVVVLPYCALEEVARSPYVKKIWRDTPAYALLDVAIPTVGGAKARELGLTGKGITIAVIDTGIHPHRDFLYPTNRILAWRDLLNQKAQPYDDNGHGTHVAGIIAGNGTVSRGKYRGMAPETQLVVLKALDQDGAGAVSSIISGVEWLLQNSKKLKIHALNLSLGTTAQESYKLDPLCRATTSAWKNGIVVCAAAGNEGPEESTINSPGINPLTLTIGNMDDQQTLKPDDDKLSPTSSRGPTIDNLVKPDLLAPGTNIASTWKNGLYRSMTGTSMATPMVTGAVALIMQKWPAATPNQVKKLLVKTSRSLGLSAVLQGAGALDLEKIFDKESPQTISAKSFHSFNFYQFISRILSGSQN